ncbi:hypothetical protein [Saccharothrix texasensis]|nr:hypothetical protein [Saccharothrix texasensis]
MKKAGRRTLTEQDVTDLVDEQIAAYRELADMTRRVRTTLSDYMLSTSY